jgi:hypothetical protein
MRHFIIIAESAEHAAQVPMASGETATHVVVPHELTSPVQWWTADGCEQINVDTYSHVKINLDDLRFPLCVWDLAGLLWRARLEDVSGESRGFPRREADIQVYATPPGGTFGLVGRHQGA